MRCAVIAGALAAVSVVGCGATHSPAEDATSPLPQVALTCDSLLPIVSEVAGETMDGGGDFAETSLSNPGLVGGCEVYGAGVAIEIHLRSPDEPSVTWSLLRDEAARAVAGVGDEAYETSFSSKPAFIARSGATEVIFTTSFAYDAPELTTEVLGRIAVSIFNELAGQ